MLFKKFPSSFTILFILMLVIAALTWIIPAGSYEMVKNEALGKMVPVAGTFHTVPANPQGLLEIALAPIDGAYDHISNAARAIDVGFFILMIGGFLAVVTRTGAIDAGIQRVTTSMEGREKWLIPILMGLFAAGGTIYGMAEETIPFYILLIPIMMRAGYDPITAIAVILLGSGMGVTGSTINPFATVIASNAAGIPFTDGMLLRIAILVIGWMICVAYVMYYAERVRKSYSHSLVADQQDADRAYFLSDKVQSSERIEMTGMHKLILTLFVATFGVMIYGVSAMGWWMGEMSALFMVMAIVIGVLARIPEDKLASTFVDGARDLLGVALVVILARGLVVIMDNGQITHTILNYAEQLIGGLSPVAFINALYWIESALSVLIPSTSGLAVLSMPILAPLADFAGVGRDLVVTAFQTASGLSHIVTPTSGVVMGALAIGHIPYSRWVRFMVPMLVILTLLNMAALSIAVLM